MNAPARAATPSAAHPNLDTGGQLLEPLLALGPRDGRVRGRRGREHEQPRAAEPALLLSEFGPLAERAVVRLLADEAEPVRLQVARKPLEPLGGAVEVAAPQVPGALRRPVRGVRQADPVFERLVLLAGTQ